MREERDMKHWVRLWPALAAFAIPACSAGDGSTPSNGSNSGSSGSAGAISGQNGGMSGQSSGSVPSQGSGQTAGQSTGNQAPGSGDIARTGSPSSGTTGSGDAGAGSLDGGDAAGSASGDAGFDGNVGTAKRFACPPGPYPTPAAGASQPICGAFQFKYNWNEGPTWITSQQAFFFSNFAQSQAGPGDIIKYTPGGQCETWLTNVGCNGLTAAYDGTLVGVCQTPRAVMAYDVVTKAPKTLASMYMGKMLDSPNDVVAHSNGSIYFTNPTYELGGRPVGVGPAIFWIDPTGTLNLISKPGGQPNGICLSPDEKRLYVVGGGVWDLDPKGVPSNQHGGFPLNADGISVDCAGNVYLSGGSIIDPTGKQIGTFPGGTMAAFGGADGKTLIVVGGGTAAHIVQMNIPGPPH